MAKSRPATDERPSTSVRRTATALRADLYRILDGVLETGRPVVIERKGRRLRIVVDEPVPAGPATSRLARLPKRPEAIAGDADDLDGLHWDDAWTPSI